MLTRKTPDMSKLRIGAYRLPAAEIVLLRIVVRLLSHDASFNWTFVETGPYDAIIAEEATAKRDSVAIAQLSSAVLKIVRKQDNFAPNTLTRPLRAEKLQEWLVQIGTSLASVSPALAAPDNTALTTRYKLRRWPPSFLVRNDPMLIRMAVLLSKRALLPIELAHLSQQSLDACHRFIDTLLPIGLLDTVPAAGPTQTVSLPKVQKLMASTNSKTFLAQGLIGRIRRRIGL